MKAAVLENIGDIPSVKEVGLTNLNVGQVLVKVIMSGICGAQIQEIKGFKGNAKFLPHLMGHEGCGVVESVGLGVTTVSVGDKVVMHWRKGDGIESPHPEYVYDNKKITSGKVTTLGEYSICSENRLTAVPDDTPPELCALLGCGLTTALGIIDNEAELKFGESVMVVGCGGVGLSVIYGASLCNAYPVVAVDILDEKHDKSLEMGATQYINSIKESLPDAKFDVIVDTTGNREVISNLCEHLSDSGRLILVGQPPPGSELVIQNAVSLFGSSGKVIKTTQGGKFQPAKDIARYVKMYKAGILNIDKLVTHKFYLDDLKKGFQAVIDGSAGRVMIDMEKKS